MSVPGEHLELTQLKMATIANMQKSAPTQSYLQLLVLYYA